MDFQIDALATANNWVHGAPTRPFTGIVSLYMADQLSAETAAREIVSVINELYYGGDSELVEENLVDLWRTITHTSKTLARSICMREPVSTEQKPSLINNSSPHTAPTVTQCDLQPDRPYYPPTPAQRKLLTLLKIITTFPTTDPMPGTMAGISHHHHPSLSPYLGATAFSSSSSYYDSSSSSHSYWGGTHVDDAETRTKCKRGIRWAALPFFREVIAEVFQEDAPGDWFHRPSQSRHTAPAPAREESHCVAPHPSARPPGTSTPIEPSPSLNPSYKPISKHSKSLLPKVGFGVFESEAWLNLTSFLAIMSKESILDGLDDVALVMMGSVLGSEGKTLFAPTSGMASGMTSHPHGQNGNHYPNLHQTQPDRNASHTITKHCLDLYVSAASIWAVIIGDNIWKRRGEDAGNEFVVGLTLDVDDAEDGVSAMSRATASQALGAGPRDATSTESCLSNTTARTKAKAEEQTPREDGRTAISRRTWDAWTGRLRAVSCREDLAASTRFIAAEAADVMFRACSKSDV
ncbi:uncharacterized protein BO97DRAFT_136436 [Aspergillus homomorphus CBS 101889]|uniref:Uncharacterized protein n=1 Tax=Aspergillus homomorphus (strain CBS 101889) TaxID=1450537 RepID=A0A395IBK7_ASPHC|nr:hypothetical protein BO97DRAFT_136436 [Aspergillus homomorphus CBS 101889]RAL16513.1 hypothetical protein BO97DRAFT_136436 [Aspergillus homomorphus CBS 101889]